MIKTLYNPQTGQITANYSGEAPFAALPPQVTDTTASIDGNWEAQKYYIDLTTLQPVAKPKDPSTVIAKYDFNYTTHQWDFNVDESSVLVRQNRDLRLTLVDKVNPVWYNSLTTQQQQDLQTYRQALLDVPEQAGFPQSVTWPTKPTWL